MNKELTTISEAEVIAQRIADRAGENTRTYEVMPTITIFNGNKSGDGLPIGSFIKCIKTEQGYSNEEFPKPLKGILIKVRMFLKLKFKYAEGKPKVVTNEFDSYSDDYLIFVKEKKREEGAKYEEVFVGNYKQVKEKYSLKNDQGKVEDKKLELHHAIYVLDIETGEIVRFDSTGLSRSHFFEYINSFSRRGLDKMSSTFTVIDSELSDTDFNGKPRKTQIAAFSFTKSDQLTVDQLIKVEKIQIEFEKQLRERDKMFGNAKEEIVPVDSVEQPEPQKTLPVINLDDEQASLGLPQDGDEEEEVRLEDVPF
jgi:hypothetical protein